MRTFLLGLIVFFVFTITQTGYGQGNTFTPSFTTTILGFEENKGQVEYHDPQYPYKIQYVLKDKGLTLFFHNKGITYQWSSVDLGETTPAEAMKRGRNPGFTEHQTAQKSTYRMDLVWDGAQENCLIIPESPLDGVTNYFLSNSEVTTASYSKIIYRNIYPHIDIEYYLKGNKLKYDVIVKRGGDLSQVKFIYNGAAPELIDGKIRIETPLGFLEEQQPITYSQNGKKLNSAYARVNQQFGFNVSESSLVQTFTIDPDLVWGSYYGGLLFDRTDDFAVDTGGNVYMSGATESTTAIALSGFQTTIGGGTRDAYLVKFNSAGVRQWATYYGGTGDDFGLDVSVDPGLNVYLSGYTNSTTGIAATGGHQTTIGGVNDGFLVKFNSAGSRLWATYYGGAGEEFSFATATDASSNVYMIGYTNSDAGIASLGHQNTRGGVYDGFIVKFNSLGVRQWGSYYGGTDNEYATGCAVDGSGNVYLGGQTFSVGSISTTGSHQPAFSGGTNRDAFLVKFNTSGARQWATYYGGTGSDYLYNTIVDAAGNVIIAGDTDSSSGIATTGTQQTTLLGVYDAFVVKFNTSGVRQWGTYYGNTGDDYAAEYKCLASDGASNIFLGGSTTSTTGIASGGFLNSLAGLSDAYLVKFNSSGERVWGS